MNNIKKKMDYFHLKILEFIIKSKYIWMKSLIKVDLNKTYHKLLKNIQKINN